MKGIYRLIIVILLYLLSASLICAQTSVSIGGLTFVQTDNSFTLTGTDATVEPVLVIPSQVKGKPVTRIGPRAFYECSVITSVAIPEGVTTIDDKAFAGCFNLEKVSFPASLKTLNGDGHFNRCPMIGSIEFAPYSQLTCISPYMFQQCDRLTDIYIPASVQTIGEAAFGWKCTRLAHVVFAQGSKLTTISKDAFRWTAIEKLDLRPCRSLTTIGDNAFRKCSQLVSVFLPASCTVLGAGTFNDDAKLQTVDFSASGQWNLYYHEDTRPAAYLFAHMVCEKYVTPIKGYGSLYFSVSRDGKSWKTLNAGKRISVDKWDYLGHPNICRGGNGRYYMIGIRWDETKPCNPVLYTSYDLIHWEAREFSRDVFDLVSTMGYENERIYLGAPKIFYDEASRQFMITWHAFEKGLTGNAMWESMRTFYVLTSDWQTFTDPKRLFAFTDTDANMATIDAIMYKENGTYYCLLKDERWPEHTSSPKSIRVTTSKNLTGPFSNPSAPICNPWQEAPCAVKKIDGSGWLVYSDVYSKDYVEQYGNQPYACYDTTNLTQKGVSQTVNMPKGCQHGDVITISESEYQALLKDFPLAE